MPIHPAMAEDLSAAVRDLYADAETRLLSLVARQIADGFEAPGWAVAKLADVQPLRRAAQGVVDALGTATQLEVFSAVTDAYDVGARAGLAELGALSDADARRIAERTPNTRAVDRLAAETVELVTATHRGILRGVEDGYRQIIGEVAATPLLGIDSRRQATQRAMERFSDAGLRTFVDRRGRSWQMTSYAEMAVRTAVGRAAVEAHGDRLRAAGIRLVIVSNAPHNCELCDPFEGRVLALDGPSGARTIEMEHAAEDGRPVRVDVAGSLDDAHRAGLQHPNCRHSTSAYLPGVTRAPVEHSEDPASYAASQRQRAIERAIRKWKNRSAAAVTPEAKRAAEARVRQYQGRMREHLAAHPELIRRREREAPGAGNLPTTAPTPPHDIVQAARVRAGDDRTLPEMRDEQLGAALRPGVLDERDRDRIAAEADRRDEQALLDRIRPGGRMVDSLAPFSDDELARVALHLDDEGMLRVMAEADRRDLDAAMPSIRTDLLGMSERDLATRARHVPEDRAAIGAEVHRRRMLDALFPAGASPPTCPRSATTCSCGARVTRAPRTRYASPPRSTAGTRPPHRRPRRGSAPTPRSRRTMPSTPPCTRCASTTRPPPTPTNGARMEPTSNAVRTAPRTCPPPSDGPTSVSSKPAQHGRRTAVTKSERCTGSTSIYRCSLPRTTPTVSC
ncbi:phage minor capsid protein [Streptomyces virginiae]|uniref:phage minor capsid protein n=1 Tax=Streptomyces virginiae TaxID=1961 RepID=UPI0036617ECC